MLHDTCCFCLRTPTCTVPARVPRCTYARVHPLKIVPCSTLACSAVLARSHNARGVAYDKYVNSINRYMFLIICNTDFFLFLTRTYHFAHLVYHTGLQVRPKLNFTNRATTEEGAKLQKQRSKQNREI